MANKMNWRFPWEGAITTRKAVARVVQFSITNPGAGASLSVLWYSLHTALAERVALHARKGRQP